MATPTPLRPLLVQPGPSRVLLGTLSASFRARRHASSSSSSSSAASPACRAPESCRGGPNALPKLALLAAAASPRTQTCIGRRSRAAAARRYSSLPPNDPEIDRIIQQAQAAQSGKGAASSASSKSTNSSDKLQQQQQQQQQPPSNSDTGTTPGDAAAEATAATAETGALATVPRPKDPPREPDSADGRPSPFSHFMDGLQTRFMAGTQTLNELTGYDSIEAIKSRNARLEAQLAEAQAKLRACRARYKTAHSARASTQREVTTLLARKDSWGPPDLERFTHLYRQDHALEAEAAAAAADLTEAEADEAALSQKLNSGIMRRYHEEQIWSDRIRRASTWGTWGLMGVNVLLFLGLQFVAEPWRRRRLVNSIAEGEKLVLDEVRKELEAVRSSLATFEAGNAARAATGDAVPTPAPAPAPSTSPAAAAGRDAAQAPPLKPTAEPASPPPPRTTATTTWAELASNPKLWRPILEDLYSDRRIYLRMRDVSVIALESAIAGAVMAALIFRR